ncbi:methyl-accepting chemotaxis protein [Hydrogenophaga sp. BPS33]|uniref:methyl-accepting chemotaxis protein n=1 Tax=Hydrogenophaga sp. BPS33 TaxID=2651974 RepID=UPI00135682AE|nr:methyl-accepting chemotaxis protein [Hydrogenophaga sp. BPS33]
MSSPSLSPQPNSSLNPPTPGSRSPARAASAVATLSRLSLRTQLLLLVVGVVLLGFAVTVVSLTRQAGNLQENTALLYAEELAARNGAQVGAELNATMTAARTLAQALGGLKSTGQADRIEADALIRNVLEGSPQFLGVWVAWEPNAFDGRDAEYVGMPGHDATGRYIPYWNRGTGTAQLEPLVDYEKAGAGDYYQLPKRTGKETLIEPYKYTVAGKEVLITTTSVPIVVNGQFVGVAGIDLPLSSLQEKVQAIRLYDTGYASLFSHGAVYVGDRDAAHVGQALSAPTELAALRTALSEHRPERVRFLHEGLGTEVTSVYVPIRVGNGDSSWAFAATVPQDRILAEVRALNLTAAVLGLASIVAVSFGLLWALQRLVLRPLGGEPAEAVAVSARVARGDLGQPVPVKAGDTHSLMAQLAVMQKDLAGVVGRVRRGAEAVASASAEISQGNQDLSSRTENQASALEETAASMEQLGTAVGQNAGHAREADQLARSATALAEQGGAAVQRVVDTMQNIDAGSRKIADIIGVIDGIAFQTNILALNAAVEAARAGEQGRGFAVVAGEVRSLATRSAQAAREIKDLIGSSVQSVGNGTVTVNEAGQTMRELITAIQQVSRLMSDISTASGEQSAGVGQVGEAVVQLDQTTQQNAALVEEMSAAAHSLRQQADELVKTVSVFRLGA